MTLMKATGDHPTTSVDRHALPDPGASVPALALPTVAILLVGWVAFVTSTTGYIQGWVPAGVTIAVNAVVTFLMFTVGHEAIHYAVSTARWVNGLVGRLAWLLVVPIISFPTYAFVHIEHHRHSNDDDRDPDAWASHSRWWQMPLRWPFPEVLYGRFILRTLRSRPKSEVAETLGLLTVSMTGLIIAVVTGNLWTLAVVFLIPQRIGLVVLVWWFDWLPHHGLADTQRSNRYGATRLRVGMEWFYTPLMLSQNYHLVHHLHPSVPFYRYRKTWRRNEDAYLQRDAAISTVFGQQLNPAEYREWKQLNGRLGRVVPVRMPDRSSATHAVLHRIPVAAVDPITDDSTLVTFAVPEALRDEFRFEPGQHVTIRTHLRGEEIRRSYSICGPATRAQLRIAVKHIPGGLFSEFVATHLRPGDVLEVMTPTGRFGTPLDPLARRHYVGLVAGSGITPVLSILEAVLAVETESRFTLIYGNRTKESTMFRYALARLQSQYADRLEIRHVLSGDPLHPQELRGRIDADKLRRWLTTDLRPDTVDEWFICGPLGLSTTARDALTAHGVEAERIHLELFTGHPGQAVGDRDYPRAAVTFTLAGQQVTFDLEAGDSILEGALQRRPDAPYSCMGGACGTCRARLLDGTVEMDQNFALGPAELAAGYVLTCQAHPTSPSVSVDYDA
ncbi:fatty acid desaturase [Mycobacterium sp. ACS4331]|uniref:fatty acid desaturase n=1 Tax=Mycobacterium sp. ACS4331 TaxID=1834121 RepID=UPI0007FBF0FD|nr:fatty acid desaturase [Mycobacterium sp. ACS4331]OBF13679.1 electron transfer flavoprotein [Mycobacterium sp. ACS4331]